MNKGESILIGENFVRKGGYAVLTYGGFHQLGFWPAVVFVHVCE